MNEYNGEEKRKDFCPVHHSKCADIKGLQIDAKKRVPIWVFVVFVSAMGGILGYMNYEIISRETMSQKLLTDHIDKSNDILSSLRHGLREVAVNLKKNMKQQDLEFEHIDRYDEYNR